MPIIPLDAMLENSVPGRGDKCLSQCAHQIEDVLRTVLVEFAEDVIEQEDRHFVATFLEVEEFGNLKSNEQCFVLPLRCKLLDAHVINAEPYLVPVRPNKGNTATELLIPPLLERFLQTLFNQPAVVGYIRQTDVVQTGGLMVSDKIAICLVHIGLEFREKLSSFVDDPAAMIHQTNCPWFQGIRLLT